MRNRVFILLLFSIIFLQCSENGNPKCSISVLNGGKTFVQGDTVEIQVELNDPDGEIVECNVYIDRLKWETFTEAIQNLYWNTSGISTGQHVFMAVVVDDYGDIDVDKLKVNIVKTAPSVVTLEPLILSPSRVILRGEIDVFGSSTINSLGFSWNQVESSNEQNISVEPRTQFERNKYFYYELVGLEPGSRYEYQSFVENEVSKELGSKVSFTTKEKIETHIENDIYTDKRDNSNYNVSKIGRQTWMAENLAYLPEVFPSENLAVDEARYYVYDYNGTDIKSAKESNEFSVNGVLYNWEAARNACPQGWHLPSHSEWDELAMFVDNEHINDSIHSFFDYNIGKYLKASWGWNQNLNGSDTYGFSAIGAGILNSGFNSLGEYCIWWSSLEFLGESAYTSQLYYTSESFQQNPYPKIGGYSIRCIKD